MDKEHGRAVAGSGIGLAIVKSVFCCIKQILAWKANPAMALSSGFEL